MSQYFKPQIPVNKTASRGTEPIVGGVKSWRTIERIIPSGDVYHDPEGLGINLVGSAALPLVDPKEILKSLKCERVFGGFRPWT